MSIRIPTRGDVYWINPNPTVSKELKDVHRFIVISPTEFNRLNSVITVPVTTGGNFARANGVTVPITGYDTSGVALCNAIRSFDLSARIKNGAAKFVETLGPEIVDAIIDRVVSILDPEELR